MEEAIAGQDAALERALLDTDDPVAIADQLSDFVSAELAPIREGLFYRRGTGIVVGLVLSDGREVVAKLHRWGITTKRLAAVQLVQEHVRILGVPAPAPLLPPTTMGAGVATLESLLDGSSGDGHDPAIRRAIAGALHGLVTAAHQLRGLADLGEPALFGADGSSEWPEPHDLRFDFAASSAGAERIDEIADGARRRLQGFDTEIVIGHMDWRAGNLGLDGARCSAIYDWDSLALAPEAVVVGAAASSFTADWARGVGLPSVNEMRAFVREYEETSGRSFAAEEREALEAANLLQCAYGARCQHSDVVLGAVAGVTADESWIELLRQRDGESLFEP